MKLYVGDQTKCGDGLSLDANNTTPISHPSIQPAERDDEDCDNDIKMELSHWTPRCECVWRRDQIPKVIKMQIHTLLAGLTLRYYLNIIIRIKNTLYLHRPFVARQSCVPSISHSERLIASLAQINKTYSDPSPCQMNNLLA